MNDATAINTIAPIAEYIYLTIKETGIATDSKITILTNYTAEKKVSLDNKLMVCVYLIYDNKQPS